jgi:hypothetical protein
MTTAPTAPPQTIDDGLAALRTVVDDAASAGDRIGLFPTVCRQVTGTIAKGVSDGLFDDAVFAGRYLTALRTWQEAPRPRAELAAGVPGGGSERPRTPAAR